MTIVISLWKSTAQILISTLILNTIASNNKSLVAELSIVPLTANQNNSNSCDFAVDNLQDVVNLTGDSILT